MAGIEDLTTQLDLHSVSHRGLNRELIPQWLRMNDPDLNGRIESSAYGETSDAITDEVAALLRMETSDALLDLGAGAGVFLCRLLTRYQFPAFGIEQNPRLVECGRRILAEFNLSPELLVQGDFLTSDWPEVTRVYAATSRFSQNTLSALADRIVATPSITRVVTLGRPLSLPGWEREFRNDRLICWNPGEETLSEALCCWAR